MFKWYGESKMCLVYLSDVPGDGQHPSHSSSEFRTSRWFSRGWTLQELLAPSVLRFYSQDWNPIGWIFKHHQSQRRDASEMDPNNLTGTLAEVTGIPEILALGVLGVREAPISAKMSWMSKRQTTRIEDMAYCMLGLFGVHMPLLYGEGHRAFTRLQEEIIKASVDHTIFAWRYGAGMPQPGVTTAEFDGLMAQSPSDFARGNRLSSSLDNSALLPGKDTSFRMTNRGLHIRLTILLFHSPGHELDDLYCALLNCLEIKNLGVKYPRHHALAIPLVAMDKVSSNMEDLDDDATLQPIQGGIPVGVSLARLGATRYYSLITRRIFIPRSPKEPAGGHYLPPLWPALPSTSRGPPTEDMILLLRNMVYTKTPWNVVEVFPPLVRAEYRGTEDLTRSPLIGSPSLEATYIFALRSKSASPAAPPSTLLHYFRLQGDRELVLAIEVQRPFGHGRSPKIRICLSAALQFPQGSLLNAFLHGSLDRFSAQCEWHELANGLPPSTSTKMLHVGGFDYEVYLSNVTSRRPEPGERPGRDHGDIESIGLFVTSLSGNQASSKEVEPPSDGETITNPSLAQPTLE